MAFNKSVFKRIIWIVLPIAAIIGIVIAVVHISKPKPGSTHIQFSIRNGKIPVRGVNLGGWLVAEHWMSPDAEIWKDVPKEAYSRGEYAAMNATADHSLAVQRFQKHHATWITEDDIKSIAQYKLNTVRVPIGYWLGGNYTNTNPDMNEWKMHAPDTLDYLDLLIRKWAKDANVAVLIDFHSVVGSQNGEDHSSPASLGDKDNRTRWHRDDHHDVYFNTTLKFVDFITNRYFLEDAFLGISLLNEPSMVITQKRLNDYYRESYKVIRKLSTDCVVITAPALQFQQPKAANDTIVTDSGRTMEDFSIYPDKPEIAVNHWHDWHKYMQWDGNFSSFSSVDTGLAYWKQDVAAWTGAPLFLGEWSLGVNASVILSSDQQKAIGVKIMDFASKMKAGWTFWSWRVDGNEYGSGWCLRDLMKAGIISL